MSAALLARLGSYICLDLETTGTSPTTDRIVQVAYATPDGQGETLVNPGVPIPASATDVHGIKDADVKDSPTFAKIAKALHARILVADVVVGFNVRGFDLPMLAEEFKRVGIDFDVETLTIVDAMTIYKTREPRDLASAVRFYCGEEHALAHNAAGDVAATVRVLAGQLERYADLPKTARELADVGRDPNALDFDGKFVWRDGAARLTFGKYAGQSMQDVDRSFFDWMLRQSFGTSTKMLARNALMGLFPNGPRIAPVPVCGVCDGDGVRTESDGLETDCADCRGTGLADPRQQAEALGEPEKGKR